MWWSGRSRWGGGCGGDYDDDGELGCGRGGRGQLRLGGARGQAGHHRAGGIRQDRHRGGQRRHPAGQNLRQDLCAGLGLGARHAPQARVSISGVYCDGGYSEDPS